MFPEASLKSFMPDAPVPTERIHFFVDIKLPEADKRVRYATYRLSYVATTSSPELVSISDVPFRDPDVNASCVAQLEFPSESNFSTMVEYWLPVRFSQTKSP